MNNSSVTIRYYGHYRSTMLFLALIGIAGILMKTFFYGATPEVYPKDHILSIFNCRSISSESLRSLIQPLFFVGAILGIACSYYVIVSHFLHSIKISAGVVYGPTKSSSFAKRTSIELYDVIGYGVNERGQFFIRDNNKEIISAGKLGQHKERLLTDFLNKHVKSSS